MTKTIMGKRPKNFKSVIVKFTFPDGDPGAIPVVFKYRTKGEYGVYLNQLFANTDTEKPATDESPDFVAIFAKADEKSVSKLLDAIESWDIEPELNKETLMQMADETPAALAAIGEAYRVACIEGKLGN